MKKYLYSSSIGTFVFDEAFRVLMEVPFDEKQKVAYGLALGNGEWIPTEEQAMKVHSPIVVVGFKTDKKNHSFSTDDAVISGISKSLRGRLFEIAAADILVAKQLVKRSVSSDDIVLEASRGLKELEKAINMVVKRLRGWYELYNPETSRSISDNEQFVDAILSKDKEELLKELKISSEESMGSSFAPHDLTPIMELAQQAQSLVKAKEAQKSYLSHLMATMYPNLSAVATPLLAAELLAQAGSLHKMAMMPSSTIQVLGAEKALFKHLKNRSVKPPKHGHIINHPIMSKVPFEKRGRAARVLADKISIAIRIDYFKGEFKGEQLLKEVEEMLLK